MLKAMNRIKVIIILCGVFLSGCSRVLDMPRAIWGSSTRALEEARVDAISKSFGCSLDECFDAILVLDRTGTPSIEGEEKFFDVFIKNRVKKYLVVMGIVGNVDTTEVGIFLSADTATSVKVEITSLSSSAKRKTAEVVFQELESRFPLPY